MKIILKRERPEYKVLEKKELLTKEEKEFLKQYIKFSGYIIDKIKKEDDNIKFYSLVYYCGKFFCKDFNNLENNKFYTLSELGLE